MYPPEITQTSSLGRLQKKSLTAYMQRMYRNRESGNPQRTMSLAHNIFKQIVEVLFECFEKALEQHWNNLLERHFADLRYVFA